MPAMRRPSGLNATPPQVVCTIRWRVSTSWPVAASQTRTVRSKLAEARRRPSGLNATQLMTPPVWPRRVSDLLAGRRVPDLHRPVPARPEARRRPSGLNATLVDRSRCARGG